MKECDRDTAGGVVAEEFDEATLPLLFKAARWERTFQTTKTEHIGGGWVSVHAVHSDENRGFSVSLGACQIGAIGKPKTVP